MHRCCRYICDDMRLSVLCFSWLTRVSYQQNSLYCSVNVPSTIRRMSMSSKMVSISVLQAQQELQKKSKLLAPSLTAGGNHKGQGGVIGVLGGSFEYTGAPYFAAITALKTGADLVHVFCYKDAAVPIKCYSPELMVHPLLEESKFEELFGWLKRMDAVVIGPGLGRSDDTVRLVGKVIDALRDVQKPLVIDADGLFVINKRHELLRGFISPVVLTPNKVELARLLEKSPPLDAENALRFLIETSWGHSIAILAKGPEDRIIMREHMIALQDLGGSNRRCGGQGDILSGALAVFLFWSRNMEQDAIPTACYAASKLVRECNALAFAIKGRSATASDMIEHIHEAFGKHFEHSDTPSST